MTKWEALEVADDIFNGNGYCYTTAHLQKASDVLWSACVINLDAILTINDEISSRY